MSFNPFQLLSLMKLKLFHLWPVGAFWNWLLSPRISHFSEKLWSLRNAQWCWFGLCRPFLSSGLRNICTYLRYNKIPHMFVLMLPIKTLDYSAFESSFYISFYLCQESWFWKTQVIIELENSIIIHSFLSHITHTAISEWQQ